MNKAETLYCCETLAKPILHDTILQLIVEREIICNPQSRHHSLSNLLDDDNDSVKGTTESSDLLNAENIQVCLSLLKFFF